MAGSIREFYRDKNVLLTGATGLVGRALAEKLIRSCDVARVFLVIRPKPGHNHQQRFAHIISNSIFERVKKESGDKMDRLIGVNGDLQLRELGLAEDTRTELQSCVDIVIHAATAATIAVTDDIKETVESNLCGTIQLLDFAKTLHNLQAFVQVSTGFVHTGLERGKSELEEVLVPVPYAKEELLMTVNRLNRSERHRTAKKIKGKYKNWYAASKCYAEWAVAEGNAFPRAIIRPTSVSAAWKEPMPGYTDSRNSQAGIVAGVYLGLFRRLNTEQAVDQVPVDFVANTAIVAAWKIATHRPAEVEIYQAASGVDKGSYRMLVSRMSFMTDYPSAKTLWYPRLKIITNPILFYISYLLYHRIPAFFFDMNLIARGRKPRVARSQEKYYQVLKHYIKYYSSNKFVFGTKNFKNLSEMVPQQERDIFYMNMDNIDWSVYYKDLMLGVRRYLLRDSDSSLLNARRRLIALRVGNALTELAFYIAIGFATSAVLSCPLTYAFALPLIIFILATVYL